MYCYDSKVYKTSKPFDIIDITDDIQKFITETENFERFAQSYGLYGVWLDCDILV